MAAGRTSLTDLFEMSRGAPRPADASRPPPSPARQSAGAIGRPVLAGPRSDGFGGVRLRGNRRGPPPPPVSHEDAMGTTPQVLSQMRLTGEQRKQWDALEERAGESLRDSESTLAELHRRQRAHGDAAFAISSPDVRNGPAARDVRMLATRVVHRNAADSPSAGEPRQAGRPHTHWGQAPWPTYGGSTTGSPGARVARARAYEADHERRTASAAFASSRPPSAQRSAALGTASVNMEDTAAEAARMGDTAALRKRRATMALHGLDHDAREHTLSQSMGSEEGGELRPRSRRPHSRPTGASRLPSSASAGYGSSGDSTVAVERPEPRSLPAGARLPRRSGARDAEGEEDEDLFLLHAAESIPRFSTLLSDLAFLRRAIASLGTCHAELAAYTRIFSPQLSALLNRVWQGATAGTEWLAREQEALVRRFAYEDARRKQAYEAELRRLHTLRSTLERRAAAAEGEAQRLRVELRGGGRQHEVLQDENDRLRSLLEAQLRDDEESDLIYSSDDGARFRDGVSGGGEGEERKREEGEEEEKAKPGDAKSAEDEEGEDENEDEDENAVGRAKIENGARGREPQAHAAGRSEEAEQKLAQARARLAESDHYARAAGGGRTSALHRRWRRQRERAEAVQGKPVVGRNYAPPAAFSSDSDGTGSAQRAGNGTSASSEGSAEVPEDEVQDEHTEDFEQKVGTRRGIFYARERECEARRQRRRRQRGRLRHAPMEGGASPASASGSPAGQRAASPASGPRSRRGGGGRLSPIQMPQGVVAGAGEPSITSPGAVPGVRWDGRAPVFGDTEVFSPAERARQGAKERLDASAARVEGEEAAAEEGKEQLAPLPPPTAATETGKSSQLDEQLEREEAWGAAVAGLRPRALEDMADFRNARASMLEDEVLRVWRRQQRLWRQQMRTLSSKRARETQARLFNHVEAEVEEQQVAVERLRQIASAGWLFMFDLRDTALREARRWADRMLGMRDKEVQTDVDPTEGKMKLPPPPPKLETDPRGAHMPEGFRRLMASFPKGTRIVPKRLLAKTMLQLYLEKIVSDSSRAEAGKAPLQAPALVAEFFFHRYGLASLRDWHITELVASLRHHRDETVGRQLESGEGTKDDGTDLGWQDARVLLFGRLIGAFPGEARYEMPAFTLLAKTVNSLMKLGYAVSMHEQAMLPDSEGRVSIQRSHALQVTKERMQQELRGGGSQTKQELVSRVQSLPRPLTARDRKSADLDHLLGVLLDEWAVRERNWRARVTAAFHAHSETERALPEDDMANTAGSSGGGDDALEAVEDGSGAEGDGSGHMVLYRASFAPAVQQLAPALTDKQATALFVSAERFTLERQWKKLNLPRGYLPDTHPRYLQGHYWYNRRLNRTYWDPPNTNSPEEIAMFLGIRLESEEEADTRQKEERQGHEGESEAPGAEAAADGVKAAGEVELQGGAKGLMDDAPGARQPLSGDEESDGASGWQQEVEAEAEQWGEEGEADEDAGYRIMADGSKVTNKQVEAARKAMEAEEQEEREEEMREAAEARMVKEVLGVDLTSFMEFCDQWQLGRVNAKSRGAANVPSAEELLLMERDRRAGGHGGSSKREGTRQGGKRAKRKGGEGATPK